MSKITRGEFNDVVKKKVEERMEVPSGYDFLREDGLLFDDYSLDSLDVMELILEFEDIYHIKVENSKIHNIRSAKDLFALVNED